MKVFSCVLFLFISFSSFAQRKNINLQGSTSISIGVIAQSYKGDLSPSYDKYDGAFHASLIFAKKSNWNGSINVIIGSATGQQVSGTPSSGSPQPNTYFRSSIFGLTYDLRYTIIHGAHVKVYASLGLGLMRYNPKDESDNKLQDLLETRAPQETYGNITLMAPLQLGAFYFFDNGYGFNFQTGFMNFFTDYIDNISELGTTSGSDNILQFRFSFVVPIENKLQN